MHRRAPNTVFVTPIASPEPRSAAPTGGEEVPGVGTAATVIPLATGQPTRGAEGIQSTVAAVCDTLTACGLSRGRVEAPRRILHARLADRGAADFVAHDPDPRVMRPKAKCSMQAQPWLRDPKPVSAGPAQGAGA